MNWRPISYPRLSVNAIATINALLSRDRPIEMANGDASYSIRPCAVRERFNTCMSLRIEVGGAAIDVHLSPATLEAVLTDLLSRQAFEELDNDFQFAVLETALADPLDTLSRYLQTPVTLTATTGIGGTGPDTDEPGCPVKEPPQHTAQPAVRDPPAIGCIPFRGAGRPRRRLARVGLADSRRRFRQAPARLRRPAPAPVVFELGRAVLPASDAQGLEPGDIVLFDESYVDDGKLRISIGDRIIHQGEINGLDLTVTATPANEARTR